MAPSRATVYQIDFTAVQSGKRIASSKRRIRWRFGFANPEAIAAGETGTACRGEEHDITLVWSITSGKRIVLADGQEVHYSSSRNTTFDYSWTMRGNHVMKLVAHANPPMSATPGFRQYDFFVDGMSFFAFPKLFRLGLGSGEGRPALAPSQLAESSHRYRQKSAEGIASIEAPHNPDEEELYLQEAIRQSLGDAKPNDKNTELTNNTSAEATTDLLDFGGPPIPALPSSALTNPYTQSTSSDPFGGSYSNYPQSDVGGVATLPTSNSYAMQPTNPGANSYATGYNAHGARASAENPYTAAAPPPDPGQGAMIPVVPSSGIYAGAPSGFFGEPSNPYGPSSSVPSSMYRGDAATVPPPNTYGSISSNSYNAPGPVPANSNPYGAHIGSDPYASGSSNAYTPNPYSTTANSNLFNTTGPSGYVVPAPIATSGFADVPPAVTPQAQQTPSTLGFGSPPADFGFSSPAPQQINEATNGFESSTDIPNPNFGLTMNSLQTEPEIVKGSEPTGLENAFTKLVNLDAFSVASKKDEKRANPFESSLNNTIGGSRSLADIQKNKPPPKKEIMKTPAPPPGSMVVSATQNGSYASQYGLQGSLGAPYGTMQYGQQTQQPMYSVGVQQQPMYGMATTQQPQSVIQSQQQPTFGQNPNVPYSSQPQPPTSFGQPQQAYDFQQYGQAQPYRFP